MQQFVNSFNTAINIFFDSSNEVFSLFWYIDFNRKTNPYIE